MRSVNCPYCGKPMKKHPKKAEYECRNAPSEKSFGGQIFK
jgi:hypothetical protein